MAWKLPQQYFMLHMTAVSLITLVMLSMTALALLHLHAQGQRSASQWLLHQRMHDLEQQLQHWQQIQASAEPDGGLGAIEQALAAHATHTLRALRNLYHDEARWWDLYLAIEEQRSAQQAYLADIQAHQQRQASHQRSLERLHQMLQQLPEQRPQFSHFSTDPVR